MAESMYGVILAGGSGTRFWPLSRADYPKQLLKIFGDQTLIQITLSRISGLIPLDRMSIVTNRRHAEQIEYQLAPTIPRLIREPIARNTAAAIGVAAIDLRQRGNPVMAVLSADHFIRDCEAFLAALTAAQALAEQGYLVTLGARAVRAETAYGYIQKGTPIGEGAFTVKRFVEKPDQQTAGQYAQSDDMFWNTGIFVWQTGTILDEIRQWMPDLSAGLETLQTGWGGDAELRTLETVYPTLPSVSIDYGVLEKSGRLAVIPVEMGWEDVGSWNALDHVLPQDAEGNIVAGQEEQVIGIGNRRTTIYASGHVVAVVGLEDVVVVNTPDATLVCSKKEAQSVRKIVDRLKEENREEYRTHRTVYRPWGSYTVMEEGERYKVKRIQVNPGSRLSLQSHRQRSEHWVVISGVARVTHGERVYTLQTNESTFIPCGDKHRLENTGDVPLEIIEVQSGPYLGEDDITRYQDDYRRTSP
jgi:mannose-1-phosphate guanylyltransferase/mannose-6-phosphate isomerase